MNQRASRRRILSVLPAALGLFLLPMADAGAESAPVLVPPPKTDIPAGSGALQSLVLAGGCFWGVQGVFQHVRGVKSAVSGYAGGSKADAHYELVSTGTTGAAESVKIVYDPKIVSYGQLLRIFFSVVHDPTEVNRQGPDEGPQYRSAIFSADDMQARVARSYVAQLDASHVFSKPIATRIEPGKSFYPAEAYHQNFLTNNPDNPYIVINDLPKLRNLQRLFPSFYRASPVLVAVAP